MWPHPLNSPTVGGAGGGNGYKDTEISLTQLSTNYMVLIKSLIWAGVVGVGGDGAQVPLR